MAVQGEALERVAGVPAGHQSQAEKAVLDVRFGADLAHDAHRGAVVPAAHEADVGVLAVAAFRIELLLEILVGPLGGATTFLPKPAARCAFNRWCNGISRQQSASAEGRKVTV